MPPFSKVLVANRGEIAIRVFRTLRELGVGCVAVYSDADRRAAHVRRADEAYRLGAGPAAESYLRGDAIVEVAARAGAEAIHPGYGFLAENAAFARLVEDAGLVWIGPPPAAIELMGSKTAARAAMRAADVPIIPGAVDPVRSGDEIAALGEELGYPLIVKAAAGGGGKGMEIVRGPDDAVRAFDAATRQGEKYFADATVYVERYLEDPRHVEVQVLADAHGNAVHLGERDCTIQRRHQKLVEETPSPAVDDALRERIGGIAVDAARAARYRSAGTIEGLLTPEGEYFFMEMNTRIQVEHTVTEAVTGLDLVREQVLVAAGEPLSVTQDEIALRGHSIECRINAEDVRAGFLPAPGRITAYSEPAGPGVRVDSGVEAGDEVSGLYDPMIAKLIVHDVDRERATARMLRALAEFRIEVRRRCSAFTVRCSSTRASSRARRARGSSSRQSSRHARKSWSRRSLIGQQVCPPGRTERHRPCRASPASRWTAGSTRCGSRSPSPRGPRSRERDASAARPGVGEPRTVR